MFIQTEDTPNPLTIKFLPGKEVMKSGTADFRKKELSENSPLASRLFEIEGVDGVFLGSDFISVTKKKDEEWFSLKPSILGKIMEHYASGDEVLKLNSIEKDEDNADESDTDSADAADDNADDDDDDEDIDADDADKLEPSVLASSPQVRAVAVTHCTQMYRTQNVIHGGYTNVSQT